MVLEAFSVSHGKASAFLPVIDMLHSYFGIDSDDDPRERREKVGGKVVLLDRSQDASLTAWNALWLLRRITEVVAARRTNIRHQLFVN